MKDRSSLAEVRNPILALPSVAAILELSPEARGVLSALLADLARDAGERAQKAWRTHKAPMAVYWKAVSVYAKHLARAVRA